MSRKAAPCSMGILPMIPAVSSASSVAQQQQKQQQDMGKMPMLRSTTRRGFLTGLARVAGGGALAALAAVLTRRSILAQSPGQALSRSGQSCPNRFICRGCGLFESCVLPQALSARQALAADADGAAGDRRAN